MNEQTISFFERQHCPGCASTDIESVYHLSYADDRLKQFIESFYQQRVDYRLLENQVYEIDKCLQCSLLFQRFVLNQAGQAALYGEWVDKGRKAGTMPPFGPLYAWATRRKIQFRDNSGKFMSYADTARAVMLKIYRKGIEPTNFYSRPFKLGFNKLPQEVTYAYALDIKDFLDFTLNELNTKYKDGSK